MELFSRLSHSLVVGTEQTDKQSSDSNGVTDKKSSSILIYLNKDTDIFTENGNVIKPNEIKS
jgi:hypothetical protein